MLPAPRRTPPLGRRFWRAKIVELTAFLNIQMIIFWHGRTFVDLRRCFTSELSRPGI
jgi:hypothetical protein